MDKHDLNYLKPKVNNLTEALKELFSDHILFGYIDLENTIYYYTDIKDNNQAGLIEMFDRLLEAEPHVYQYMKMAITLHEATRLNKNEN